MSQVGDGGGGDVASPAIFNGHRNAQRNAKIAGLSRFCQAAELADLNIDDVGRTVGV